MQMKGDLPNITGKKSANKKNKGDSKPKLRRLPRVDGKKVQWASSEAKKAATTAIYSGVLPVVKDHLDQWSIESIDLLWNSDEKYRLWTFSNFSANIRTIANNFATDQLTKNIAPSSILKKVEIDKAIEMDINQAAQGLANLGLTGKAANNKKNGDENNSGGGGGAGAGGSDNNNNNGGNNNNNYQDEGWEAQALREIMRQGGHSK